MGMVEEWNGGIQCSAWNGGIQCLCMIGSEHEMVEYWNGTEWWNGGIVNNGVK